MIRRILARAATVYLQRLHMAYRTAHMYEYLARHQQPDARLATWLRYR